MAVTENKLAVNSSTANVFPTITVYGPGTLRQIRNHSTGKAIYFKDLTLLVGEVIKMSLDPLNYYMISDWTERSNVIRYIDVGSSPAEFYLFPGSNSVQVYMTGTNSASAVYLEWVPLFWGLDGAVLK